MLRERWASQFSLGGASEDCLEVCLTSTVKDFIGYLFPLYYCCFTCFTSIGIGKTKSTIESVLQFMRLTLNWSVCTAISACTNPCNTNTFTHSVTRIHILQRKIHNVWIKFFWKQNILHLGIKEISTLKLFIKLFLIKLIIL